MAKVSPMMVLPPVIFAGLAVMFYAGMNRENGDALPSAIAGKQAPPVVLTQLGEGAPFTDETLHAPGVKLVNYWASWCAPCRVEHPNLTALAAEGIPIYGVNYKDFEPNARAFLQELGDPYVAVGSDPNGFQAINWGVYGVPETFLVDGDGTILLRMAAPVTNRELEGRLRPAIQEALSQ